MRRAGRVEAAGAKLAASTATAGGGTFVASARHDGRFLLLLLEKGLGEVLARSRAVGIMDDLQTLLDLPVFVSCCGRSSFRVILEGVVSKKIFPAFIGTVTYNK